MRQALAPPIKRWAERCQLVILWVSEPRSLADRRWLPSNHRGDLFLCDFSCPHENDSRLCDPGFSQLEQKWFYQALSSFSADHSLREYDIQPVRLVERFEGGYTLRFCGFSPADRLEIELMRVSRYEPKYVISAAREAGLIKEKGFHSNTFLPLEFMLFCRK